MSWWSEVKTETYQDFMHFVGHHNSTVLLYLHYIFTCCIYVGLSLHVEILLANQSVNLQFMIM